MAKHNLIGEEGERIAVQYLNSKGYLIYHKNWRLGKLEVDIIAEDGYELVFIEVKSRSSLAYGKPEDAVDEKKELAIVNAADIYTRDFNLEVAVRFDIVTVLFQDNKIKVNHLIDHFSGFEMELF